MLNHPTFFEDWQSYPANVLKVDEVPKLGSGKTDFNGTKKIALANDQE